jgi:hypothetical protein
MGSFAVERFSAVRIFEITMKDISARVNEIHRLVAFEQEIGA